MSRCDAEMCPFWTGHGCACEVLDIPEDERAAARRTLGDIIDEHSTGEWLP